MKPSRDELYQKGWQALATGHFDAFSLRDDDTIALLSDECRGFDDEHVVGLLPAGTFGNIIDNPNVPIPKCLYGKVYFCGYVDRCDECREWAEGAS